MVTSKKKRVYLKTLSSKGIPVSVWIPSHVEWIHANEVWIPSTLEWIHTQIASQTSELRCKNSFKKSHFLITISPQKNFLSNVILSCSRTDLVKYMHWLRMNSYHIGMNSFLIRMDSFRSRKQVCKNVQYGTVRYSTVQYSLVHNSTVQCSTVLYDIVNPMPLWTKMYLALLDQFMKM